MQVTKKTERGAERRDIGTPFQFLKSLEPAPSPRHDLLHVFLFLPVSDGFLAIAVKRVLESTF